MGDDHKSKEHEKAYDEGVREARESDALSQAAHNLNPFGPSTTTEKSREAGWRDYWDGKAKTKDVKSERPEPRTSKQSKGSYVPYRSSNTYPTGEGARTGGSLDRSRSFVKPRHHPPAKVGMLVLGLLLVVGGLAQMSGMTANPQFSAPWFWLGLGVFILAWRFYIRRRR